MVNATVPAGAIGTAVLTLDPNAANTVTFTGSDGNAFIEVITSATPSADIWWTLDGTTAAVGVGYFMPNGLQGVDRQPVRGDGDIKVSVFTAAATTVRVQRVD